MNDKNRRLLEVTALLIEAAETDERLSTLATNAKKIVLEDTEALTTLFASFKNPPTDTVPARNLVMEQMRAAKQASSPPQKVDEAISFLQQILDKAKQ